MSKVSTTIRLSDTVDQYARRAHVNVRNDKVTMVYRWKDHFSRKAHTQRMTLTDAQVGQLMGALTKAAGKTIAQADDRRQTMFANMVATIADGKFE